MLKRQTVSLVKKNASHQRDDCIKKNCWRFKNYLIFQHGKFIWKFAFNNFHQIFVNDWLHILIQIIPVTEISIIICWTNKLECHTECKKKTFHLISTPSIDHIFMSARHFFHDVLKFPKESFWMNRIFIRCAKSQNTMNSLH